LLNLLPAGDFAWHVYKNVPVGCRFLDFLSIIFYLETESLAILHLALLEANIIGY